jgi:hypothetical protein
VVRRLEEKINGLQQLGIIDVGNTLTTAVLAITE